MEYLDNEHLAEHESGNEDPESGLAVKLDKSIMIRYAVGILSCAVFILILLIWVYAQSTRDAVDAPLPVLSLVLALLVGIPSLIIARGLSRSRRWAIWTAIAYDATILSCMAGYALSMTKLFSVVVLALVLIEGMYLIPLVWHWSRARLVFIISVGFFFSIGPLLSILAAGTWLLQNSFFDRDSLVAVASIPLMVGISIGIGAAVGKLFSWMLVPSADRTGLRLVSGLISGFVAVIISVIVNWLILVISILQPSDDIPGVYAIGISFLVGGTTGLVFGALGMRPSQDDRNSQA